MSAASMANSGTGDTVPTDSHSQRHRVSVKLRTKSASTVLHGQQLRWAGAQGKAGVPQQHHPFAIGHWWNKEGPVGDEVCSGSEDCRHQETNVFSCCERGS